MIKRTFNKDNVFKVIAWVTQELGNLAEGDYEITVDKAKKKRSLDANAYCWVLVGKLASKMRVPKDEVYTKFIKDIGDFDVVCCQDRTVDKLCEQWSSGHLGRLTERFPSKLDGCTNVRLYFGSSDYDSKQMARLIDAVVEECKIQDIETWTPVQLQALKDGWK